MTARKILLWTTFISKFMREKWRQYRAQTLNEINERLFTFIYHHFVLILNLSDSLVERSHSR